MCARLGGAWEAATDEVVCGIPAVDCGAAWGVRWVGCECCDETLGAAVGAIGTGCDAVGDCGGEDSFGGVGVEFVGVDPELVAFSSGELSPASAAADALVGGGEAVAGDGVDGGVAVGSVV